MPTRLWVALLGVLLCLVAACGHLSVAWPRLSPASPPASRRARAEESQTPAREAALPTPITEGSLSLEEVLRRRRSVRRFRPLALKREQIGQLLWAGQGITDRRRGGRTSPSAGAIHPMQLYLVTREGVFVYLPAGHRLRRLASGDRLARLTQASGQQAWILGAPAIIVVAGDPDRLRDRYRDRSERFLYLEGGHIAQNILLQAVSLGLGSVPVGGFDDTAVANAVGLPAKERPVYLLPVGNPDTA